MTGSKVVLNAKHWVNKVETLLQQIMIAMSKHLVVPLNDTIHIKSTKWI